MPDGRTLEPGGWNRIHLIVENIAGEVERLRAAGLSFRSDIVSGPGGQQILIDDPAGNPIDSSSRPAASRTSGRPARTTTPWRAWPASEAPETTRGGALAAPRIVQ